MAGRLHIAPIDISQLVPDLVMETPLLTGANLAPRRMLSGIRLDAGRPRLEQLFWGLTPPWLEVLDHAPHCARAESLASRRMFREAFHARRCLIPATGVYVWKPQPRFKQPFLVTRVDRGPLLLAALWCRFHTSLAEHTDSMALITVPTNGLLAPLSDRLPAAIPPAEARRWLDPQTPSEAAQAMLAPAPRELLGAFPVSRRVNNPANQDAACAHPVGPMLRHEA
ncbi:SOS response-associated peptidase [Halomonas icarae]|uniref:Abasic site processing protein n=1 Tax=Halomonas icarae TaxID=2691040 RepID=A0A7X5ANG9_9GAMM|nr:SOS response-associated peptidase [Halomonas icarae]MDR5900627.1 SOS response-associated peptidase [Halomonas icarae]NAW13904.1 SOS response-associated peptidase [Halomonas icarae]